MVKMAMAAVWIKDQLRIWQSLLKSKAVRGGDHEVVLSKSSVLARGWARDHAGFKLDESLTFPLVMRTGVFSPGSLSYDPLRPLVSFTRSHDEARLV